MFVCEGSLQGRKIRSNENCRSSDLQKKLMDEDTHAAKSVMQ